MFDSNETLRERIKKSLQPWKQYEFRDDRLVMGCGNKGIIYFLSFFLSSCVCCFVLFYSLFSFFFSFLYCTNIGLSLPVFTITSLFFFYCSQRCLRLSRRKKKELQNSWTWMFSHDSCEGTSWRLV